MADLEEARRPLLALLEAHRPEDDAERRHRDAMVDHLRTLEAPFSRDQPGAHFTGSAVVVAPDGARVALVHHRKLGRWLQPGGHVEAGDAGRLERTALREAAEETGLAVALHPAAPRPLDLDAHLIPARGEVAAHHHLDVRFLVVAEDPERLRHDPGESFGARWFGWDEALGLADDGALSRFLRKARAIAG